MTKQQLLAQAGRFARLAVTAFVATGIVQQLVTGKATQAMVVSAAVGAIEVAYRTVRPTVSTDAVEKAVLSHLSSLLRHSLHVHAMPDPRAVAGDVEGGGYASAGAIPAPEPAPAAPVDVTTVSAPPAAPEPSAAPAPTTTPPAAAPPVV